MILGMSIATFTIVHVVISLIGILTGAVMLGGLIAGKRLDNWTAAFLATTIATSVSGFAFPVDRLLPAHVIGMISLLLLTVAMLARYTYRLAGGWRRTWVITASLALYLNVFIGVVQAFQKIPPLRALAPTQSEPPFVAAQVTALLLLTGLAIAATVKFRDLPVRSAA